MALLFLMLQSPLQRRHDFLEEHLDEFRVELPARFFFDDRERLIKRLRFPVWASRHHHVERVGNRDNPCRERNLFAADAFRISFAVPTLMMGEYNL